MPRLRYEDLLELYRHTAFDPSGDEGILTIASPQALAILQLIETEEAAGEDANLAVLVDEANLSVGQTVRVRVGAPRISLGLLVRSVNDLLKAPEARVAEPAAYFVINGGIDPWKTPAPALIETYRQVLAVVDLLSMAAAYLDKTRQELVFVHDGKVPVPVRYDQAVLERVSATAIKGLLENFRDDVHQDQKLAILEDAVVQMIEGQSMSKRFIYLLDNLDALNESVRKGYRLFASSFSYKKIRGEIEAAKVDYVGKIHKTLVDIQLQLLSIPVATTFGWVAYKTLRNADPVAQGVFQRFNHWHDAAAMDFAWWVLVVLAGGAFDVGGFTFYLSTTALGTSLVWWRLGDVAVRWQWSHVFTWLYLPLSIGLPGYAGYVAYAFYQDGSIFLAGMTPVHYLVLVGGGVVMRVVLVVVGCKMRYHEDWRLTREVLGMIKEGRQ